MWGEPPAKVADERRRDVEQALLEEPQPVADLVDHPGPPGPNLVRLPERGHLLGNRGLDRLARGARQGGIVQLVEQPMQPDLGGEHRSASRLRRMRGEHELERQPPARRREPSRAHPRPLEGGEGIAERLARRPPLVLVLPPATEAVVLLGEVGELEVQRERAQHLRLALDGKCAHSRGQPPARRLRSGRACAPGELADALLGVEQAAAALLDEHAAKDVAEQADVPSEGRFRAVGAHGRSGVPAGPRSRA